MDKFLITQSVIFTKKNGYSFVLDKSWHDYAKRLKIRILPYDYIFNEKNIRCLKISGIILTGGNDLNFLNKNKANLFRDKNEAKLLSFALKNNIRVLGICRGFQIVAKILNKKKNFIKKTNFHVRVNHKLNVRNSNFIKDCKLIVNYYHNFLVEKMPSKFNIVSQLKDNSIEIAESKDKKILLFMFHPERKNLSQSKIDTYLKKFLKK